MNVSTDWYNMNINIDEYVNNAVQKVILHIGMHKTATSSIQATLYNNKKILSTVYDIYYSSNEKSDNAFTLFGLFCDDPVHKYDHHFERGHTYDDVEMFNRDNLLILLEEIKVYKTKVFLFSEEHLCRLDLENLKEMKLFLDKLFPNAFYKIVISLRNPIDYFSSSFQQFIVGNIFTFDDSVRFVSNFENLYSGRISNYIECFGKDKLYVYSFEQTFVESGDPVHFFLKNVLKIKKDQLNKLNFTRTNEGKSYYALEIASFINKRCPYFVNGQKSKKRDFKDIHPFMKISGKKYHISSIISTHLFDVIKEDMKWLNDEFQINYFESFKTQDNFNESVITYDEKYYKEILMIYPSLTKLMKKMLHEFLKFKRESLIDKKSMVWIDKLEERLQYFESYNEVLLVDVKKISIFFCKQFLNNENKEHPQVYRDIALFCEMNGEYEVAYKFMKIAHDYAPNGPFISRKCEELEKIVKMDRSIEKLYI